MPILNGTGQRVVAVLGAAVVSAAVVVGIQVVDQGGQDVTVAAECAISTMHVPDGPDGMGGCWPGPSNTGATITPSENYVGPCGIYEDTLIENKLIACDLQVYEGASLTIRNSVASGFMENASTGVLEIADSEIHAGDTWPGGALWGANISATRVEITGGQQSVSCAGDCTIIDSWLHDQAAPPGTDTHNNAYLTNGGLRHTLRHNVLHCTPEDNGAGGGCSSDVSFFGDFAAVGDITVEKNLIPATPSGSYCTYAGYNPGKTYPTPVGVVIYQDNVFGRWPSGKCGVFGTVTSWLDTGNVWDNNTFTDGTPVDPITN